MRKIMALLISVLLLLNFVACSGGGGEVASRPSENLSSGELSSETSSEDKYGGNLGGTKTDGTDDHHDYYDYPSEEVSSDMAPSNITNVSSEDGNSSDALPDSLFGNPKNYTIVYPVNDAAARKQAVKIQQWFSTKYDCKLPIFSDIGSSGELEILVGKTSRKESSSMAEGPYKVSIKGKKLVFDASHAAMVELAVQKFLEANPQKESDLNISGKIEDFKATMLGKYNYVWGDEFEGDEVNFSKWTFNAKMSAYNDAAIATDRDVIDIKNGKLILRSMVLKDSKQPKIDYKMPTSVVTQYNMMYTYGYCEIKAKVPCAKGTWPSFWTQSKTGIGKRDCWDYFVEVDVFEVFGTTNGVIVPNLHKWYTKEKGGHHVMSGSANSVILGSKTGEYHTYGYEWTPTEISMYVDGKKYQTYNITNPKILSGNPDNDMSGFHDPQYIIFNNHLFTDKASFKPNLIEGNEKVLPSQYSIEYFRLYQKKDEGKLWTDDTVWKTFTNR